jgi:hypothetical protein
VAARVGGRAPFQTRDLVSGLEDLGLGHAPARGKVDFEDVRRLGASNRNAGPRRRPCLPIGPQRAHHITPVHHYFPGVEDGQDPIYLMRVLQRASVCLGVCIGYRAKSCNFAR